MHPRNVENTQAYTERRKVFTAVETLSVGMTSDLGTRIGYVTMDSGANCIIRFAA